MRSRKAVVCVYMHCAMQASVQIRCSAQWKCVCHGWQCAYPKRSVCKHKEGVRGGAAASGQDPRYRLTRNTGVRNQAALPDTPNKQASQQASKRASSERTNKQASRQASKHLICKANNNLLRRNLKASERALCQASQQSNK